MHSCAFFNEISYMKNYEVEAGCPQCGHNEYIITDNLKDDDFIQCDNCGFEIMFGDLKEISLNSTREKALSIGKAEAEKIAKNLFKNLK